MIFAVRKAIGSEGAGAGRSLVSAVGGALVAGLLGPAAGWAQGTQDGDVVSHAAPEVRVERTAAPIEIDGRLSEESWAQAAAITRFTQVDPQEGAPVSEPTEVRILFDDEALYVGARLLDSQPVSRRLGRRDAYLSDSDWFSVTLDSYHDHRTAYRFMVNPSGVRADEVLSDGEGDRGDDSWDPIWTVATAVTDSGWVAELRIPFAQLRFRPAESLTWGLQLEREIARRQEEAVFAFTPKRERGGIARFGHLTGLRAVRPSGRWEFLPYLVGRATYAEVEPEPGAGFPNPFRDGSDYFGGMGVDVKYRLTSNLTVDATLNPDFGQVEADPAEVNLSAFESRFDEKRPFFIEGADIFDFGTGGWGGMELFYTRRVGRAPQVDGIPDAVYRDVPEASTILAAAKVTGKTAGGWSIGVLEAVTDRETAAFIDGTGEVREAEVEPLANYFVARARREMREGQTLLGGILTAAHRDLSSARVRDELRSSAYTGGLDFQHEWADRSWALSGFVVGSHIRGEPGVVLDAQLSPARYYQRPDALYLDLDSTATSLAGYAGSLRLEKQSGLHWRGDLSASATSPGFEINDLGYYYDADRLEVDGNLRYVENQPGDLFRSWWISGGPSADWNYGGDFLGSRLGLRTNWELLSYWSGHLGLDRSFGGVDDRLTRGGPLTRGLSESGVSLEVRSDERKSVTVEVQASYDWDDAGGWSRSGQFDVELRPAPNWNLSLGPRISAERSAAQYLGTVEDPLATETFGNRYLFADLEQTTLSLQTRLNVIFTPELTLEVYAEPFLASGDYGPPKELASPRSFDFRRFGSDVGTLAPLPSASETEAYLVDPDGEGPARAFEVENEDFRTGSLRGNAVLRWQWRPGSTLFLVWQQERSSYDRIGRFRLGPGFDDLWRARPDNVFLIKVSYWLGM